MDAGGDPQPDTSIADPQPETAVDAGDEAQPKEPPPEFQVVQKTILWSVIGKVCERILFSPSTPLDGTAFIHGQSFDYKIRGNQLDLRAFYFFQDKGGLGPGCQTVFLIGPEFATLGGANLYRTESECQAAKKKAIALDDSPWATRKSRCGVPAPVVTDQAKCHPKCIGYCPPTPGCISTLRSVWRRDFRSR
jgi:hypothetical protein